MGSVTKRCYCAFCKSPRTVYLKRHVGVIDVFLSLAAGTLLSFIIWQEIDPRLLAFFAIGLGLAELFISVRWRMTIACGRCGFDPVLYKKKPELAAARVKDHYKRRLEDPLMAFSPPPKLPVIVKRKSTHSSSTEAMR